MKHRVVTVRYRLCVYADVDLDSGEVTRVVEGDEDIRLDFPADDAEDGSADPSEVVEQAYDDDAEAIEVEITPEIAKQAIQIAEASEWPAWERA